MQKLYDLLSDETKEALKNSGSHVSFDWGWFYNSAGKIGIVTEAPAAVSQKEESKPTPGGVILLSRNANTSNEDINKLKSIGYEVILVDGDPRERSLFVSKRN